MEVRLCQPTLACGKIADKHTLKLLAKRLQLDTGGRYRSQAEQSHIRAFRKKHMPKVSSSLTPLTCPCCEKSVCPQLEWSRLLIQSPSSPRTTPKVSYFYFHYSFVSAIHLCSPSWQNSHHLLFFVPFTYIYPLWLSSISSVPGCMEDEVKERERKTTSNAPLISFLFC